MLITIHHSDEDEDEDEDDAIFNDEPGPSTGQLLHFPSGAGDGMIQGPATDEDLFDVVDDAEEEVYIPLPESLTSLRSELLISNFHSTYPSKPGPLSSL
jgi:hypothetical protein